MKIQFHIISLLALATIVAIGLAFPVAAIVVLFSFIVFTNLAVVFGPLVVGGFAYAFRVRDDSPETFNEDRFGLVALFSWLLCVAVSALSWLVFLIMKV